MRCPDCGKTSEATLGGLGRGRRTDRVHAHRMLPLMCQGHPDLREKSNDDAYYLTPRYKRRSFWETWGYPTEKRRVS